MFKMDRLTRRCELANWVCNDVGLFPANLVMKLITGTMLTFSQCSRFAIISDRQKN